MALARGREQLPRAWTWQSPKSRIMAAITSGRWAFLARPFDEWFRHAQYSDRDGDEAACVPLRGLQFDAFHVCVPSTANAATLAKLRRATALVGLMLSVDTSAWWYVRVPFTPWFNTFFPSDYDAATLVPTMMVVPGDRFGRGQDDHNAMRAIRDLLVPLSTSGPLQRGDEDDEYDQSRLRILATPEARRHHTKRRLRVPIIVQLSPSSASRELQAYLSDAIKMVRAVQQAKEESPDYPVDLVEIRLALPAQHVGEASDELRRLFALRVAVTLRLRRTNDGRMDVAPLQTVYPALVGGGRGPLTLHHRAAFSSEQLWSAVALSPVLETLVVDQQYLQDGQVRARHARWLAYALRQSTSLKSLVLTMFEPTEREARLMHEVAAAANPSRLLYEATDASSNDSASLEVTLRDDTEFTTSDGTSHPLARVGLAARPTFPLVYHDEITHHVYFVVPGYALCSASTASIVSIQPAEPTERHGLTSLAVYSDEERPGVAAALVRIAGPKSLRHFRWTANEELLEEGDPVFDDDLQAILTGCPLLESVALKYRFLQRLDALLHAPPTTKLRSLSLVHVPVDPAELSRLFATLADRTASLTRTLEELQYECDSQPLDEPQLHAAMAMLDTNRRLTLVRLGTSTVWRTHFASRVERLRQVQVVGERLALRAKLAVVSVVHGSQGAALGRLDDACVAGILQWFSRGVGRQLELIAMDQGTVQRPA